ncbi:hypothetical protein A3Q56_04662, partial [Intoshia linei]
MEKEYLPGKQNGSLARDAVFVKSKIDLKSEIVKGYDFNDGLDYDKLLATSNCGFQATNFGRCIEEINRMISKRFEKTVECSFYNEFPKNNCTIFIGYTSNLISCGLRETVRYLAEHNMVDVIVSTAGGIEEDFIKCLGSTYVGDFHLDGRKLREQGINRIGNLLVPNDNYCKFEDWIMPILEKMLQEQNEFNISWTPSKFIHRLGKEINHPSSVYYWCYKNNIPVFSPALTDGSIGDMLHFFSYNHPGLKIDIVEDITYINKIATSSLNSGMIILGGGLIKHHICNANLMRNGADFSVFINSGHEFDGSDSGARPDEAISWGKISIQAKPVKLCADFTLVFPLIVAQTFYQHRKKFNNSNNVVIDVIDQFEENDADIDSFKKTTLFNTITNSWVIDEEKINEIIHKKFTSKKFSYVIVNDFSRQFVLEGCGYDTDNCGDRYIISTHKTLNSKKEKLIEEIGINNLKFNESKRVDFYVNSKKIAHVRYFKDFISRRLMIKYNPVGNIYTRNYPSM